MIVSYREAWSLPRQFTQRRSVMWGLVGNALISIFIIPAFRIYGMIDFILEHLRGPNPQGPIDFNWHMVLLKRGFFLWLKVIVTALCWAYGTLLAVRWVVVVPLTLLTGSNFARESVDLVAALLCVFGGGPMTMVAIARLFRTGSLDSVFQVVPILRFTARHYFQVLWCGLMFVWLSLVLYVCAYFTLGYFSGWAALAQASLLAQLGRAADAEFAPWHPDKWAVAALIAALGLGVVAVICSIVVPYAARAQDVVAVVVGILLWRLGRPAQAAAGKAP